MHSLCVYLLEMFMYLFIGNYLPIVHRVPATALDSRDLNGKENKTKQILWLSERDNKTDYR